MSFTLGTTLTQFASSVAGTTITFTGVAIPAGSLVVFGWSANVASLTATVSDNSTQSGAANQYVLRPLLNGTTFTSQSIYCLRITRALLTTDTITITISGSASRTAGWGGYWTPSNGNAQLENRSSVANAVASPASAPVMSTTQWAASNDMAILIGYWKGAGVASGFANASVNMPGAGTHGSASSGGVTTRVEVNLASSLTMGSTAWTPSATYTSITVANVEGLTFTDNARPSAACVQYHSMPRGFAGAGITAEIGPCTAGNLLLLAISTNENAGADNITTPSGWNLAGTFRQGTTDVNMALFSKIAAGGETSQAVVTSIAQRVVAHWSEWAGFTELQDVTRATAGSTALVSTLSSGTVTPNGPGRLFYAMVTQKNAGPLTEGGGFGELLVNNEAGANSTQKIAMGVYSDANRSAAATEQPTVATAAGYAGMAFLFSSSASSMVSAARSLLIGSDPRSLRSRVFSAITADAAPAGSDFTVMATTDKAPPAYSPPRSQTMPIVGDGTAVQLTDRLDAAVSRVITLPVQRRSSTAFPAFDLPFLPAGLATVSRQVPAFSSPRSSVLVALSPDTVFSVDWEPNAVVSRQAPDYAAPRSIVLIVLSPDVVVSTDWEPTAIYSRQSPDYSPPRSSVLNLIQPEIFGGSGLAVTSRPVPDYSSVRSTVLTALSPDVVAAYSQAAVMSRAVADYSPPRSSVLILISPDSPAAVGTPGMAVRSPRLPMYVARSSIVFNATGVGSVVVDFPTGGGGLGFEPGPGYLQRYRPEYRPGYRPGYKPTLRKQR